MKPFGRWTWQCNSCDTVMQENEWRTVDDRRELPLCEKCGKLVWGILKVDFCPEGCLLIEFGSDQKVGEEDLVELGEVEL